MWKRQAMSARANISGMAKARGRPPTKKKLPPEPTRIGRLSKLHAYVDEWLEGKGVSDAQLADRLDTSPSNITKWRDRGWKIGIPNIGAIAHALDIDPPERIFTHPKTDPREEIREEVRQAAQEALRKILS